MGKQISYELYYILLEYKLFQLGDYCCYDIDYAE